MRISLLSVVVAACLLFVPAAGAKTVLRGSVGPGFTITLKNAAGQKVTKLKAGVYVISVADKSSIHNFHLKGPGVNKVITSVAFTGTKATVVTLKKGTYTSVCDPHASIMHGTFKVV